MTHQHVVECDWQSHLITILKCRVTLLLFRESKLTALHNQLFHAAALWHNKQKPDNEGGWLTAKHSNFVKRKKGMETKNVDAVGHLLGLAFTLLSCGVLAEDYPEPRSIWSPNSQSNTHKILKISKNNSSSFWPCENKSFHCCKETRLIVDFQWNIGHFRIVLLGGTGVGGSNLSFIRILTKIANINKS